MSTENFKLRLGRFLTALAVFLVINSTGAHAENWPQWRGPNGDGTTAETGLPSEWTTEKNIAWRLEMPGPAASTPAIWDERIFLTSADGDDIVLLCISTAGKELWRGDLGTGNRNARRDEGNSAATSASTDGAHVWAFAGTGDLACFDVDGKSVWKKNLQELYGDYDHWHGMGNTPLLEGDSIYQMCLQMNAPYVVAFDKLTGKERWKVSRESDARNESRHSYASPILYREGDSKLLLVHGADYLTAHRLDDGSEVWRVGHLNSKDDYNGFLRFVASPVCRPGLVVVPSAKGRPVLGVSPAGKKGEIAKSDLLWFRGRDTTDVPTPAIHDDLVYLLRENGVLYALDAKTGDEVYEERIHRTRQRASPVVADGKVYIAARDGVIYVVRAGRQFEVLAQNDMGDGIAATPAISGGRIYLRTMKALWAVAK